MAEPALASDHGAAQQASGIAVIIPTLDEEASIADVVRSLPRAIVSRVIVADGGSRDATAQRASAAGADVIEAGRGYGRACLAAATAAEGTASSVVPAVYQASAEAAPVSAGARPTTPPGPTRSRTVPTGSPAAAKTIGIVVVALFAAAAAAVLAVTMTSTLRRTNSSANSA